MSVDVFQELKIRAQLDPVVRRNLAAHPLQFLANFDLSFDEKRQIILPHFSWINENRLAAMSFPDRRCICDVTATTDKCYTQPYGIS